MSLETQYSMISLEASSGVEGVRHAVSRLPHFMKTLTGQIGKALAHPISAFFPKNNLERAAAVCMAVPYQQMRTRAIPVVPGLSVDYLTYTNALAQSATLCSQIEPNMLQPTINAMARLLNDPDQFRTVRPSAEFVTVDIAPLNSASKTVLKMIDHAKDTATAPYGTVIRRNADWAEIIKNSQHVNTVFTSADHVRFMSTVERLNELVATMIQRLSNDQDAYKVSGPMLKKIIDAIYNCGLAVEFFGLTYRRVLVYNTAMDRFIEQYK